MKSYLLSKVDDGIKASLLAANVQFFHWGEGIIFPDRKALDDALAVFDARALEQPTSYANLTGVNLVFNSRDIKPEFALLRSDEVARTRLNYVNACKGRISNLATEFEQTLDNLGKTLPPLARALFDAHRARYLAEINHSAKSLQEHLAEQVDAVYKLPQVKDLQCLPGPQGTVHISTDTLHTLSSVSGTKRELGRFTIFLSLSGRELPLRLMNSDRRKNALRADMHAPNVWADGKPCYSELDIVWIELLARFELAAAVELALQFLEASGADPFLGKHADAWPASIVT